MISGPKTSPRINFGCMNNTYNRFWGYNGNNAIEGGYEVDIDNDALDSSLDLELLIVNTLDKNRILPKLELYIQNEVNSLDEFGFFGYCVFTLSDDEHLIVVTSDDATFGEIEDSLQVGFKFVCHACNASLQRELPSIEYNKIKKLISF